MKDCVIVDTLGSDLGAKPLITGALEAHLEKKIPITLIGDESQILKLAKRYKLSAKSFSIINCTNQVSMSDTVVTAVKTREQNSIKTAFKLLQEEKGAALVSAGNTAAIMAIGVLEAGTFSGIARPAIATALPTFNNKGTVILVDSGANVDCNAYQLVQFALMGSAYNSFLTGAKSPAVAILSNGSEPSKGNDVTKSAAIMMAQNPDINFCGYVEGCDITAHKADVVVTDGFVGNIVLKTMEGTAQTVLRAIKQRKKKTLLSKIGFSLVGEEIKALFDEALTPHAYGGAPLLGLKKLVLVCHGRANKTAVKNAVESAYSLYKDNLLKKMEDILERFEIEK